MTSSRERLVVEAESNRAEPKEWSQFCSSEASFTTADPFAGRCVRFAGCYLLSSLKRPRTYIGFTVNPARRIQQHNGERPTGGAVRTSVNRPWIMLAIVHGFITTGQALQFEWAWQNPGKTRCIKLHGAEFCAQPLRPKRPRFPTPAHQISQLATLLSVPPWARCPLTITVLVSKVEWAKTLDKTVLPPWVRVNFRQLQALGKLDDYDYGAWELPPRQAITGDCSLCTERTDSNRRGSICIQCGATFHVHCVASLGAAERDEKLPAPVLHPREVKCPGCACHISWAEVVRFAHVVRRALLSAQAVVTDTS